MRRRPSKPLALAVALLAPMVQLSTAAVAAVNISLSLFEDSNYLIGASSVVNFPITVSEPITTLTLTSVQLRGEKGAIYMSARPVSTGGINSQQQQLTDTTEGTTLSCPIYFSPGSQSGLELRNTSGIANRVMRDAFNTSKPLPVFLYLTYNAGPRKRGLEVREDSEFSSLPFGLSNAGKGTPEFLVQQKNFAEASPSTTPKTEDGPGGASQTQTEYPNGSTNTPTSSGSPPSSTSQTNSGGAASSATSDNSLSTGAIAGIAVGAAVGVLVIASALACLLLRRRRRNLAASSGRPPMGYSPHSGRHHGAGRSAEIIAEKEATAGVAESPHSPYSDDGHQRDSSLMGPAAAGGVAAGLMAAHNGHPGSPLHQQQNHPYLAHAVGHAPPSDYAPYSDHPSPAVGSPVGVPALSTPRSSTAFPAASSSSAAGTPPSAHHSAVVSPMPAPSSLAAAEDEPPASAARTAAAAAMPRAGTGMSGRYAHLVEVGMTAAEIARMEEEERELDAAIASARGVTTK